MSFSPFMTPDQSRRRREFRRRRRRRRRAVIAGVLALVIAAALVVMALANSHPTHGSAAAATHGPKPPLAGATLRRSPSGLPLAKPAFALTGIATPQLDPIAVSFAEPPRAGLLFNLNSGQVLWQRNPYSRLRIASLTKMMTALLTVESAPPDTPVLVTRQAVEAAGSKVGVLPLGRHVRLETMLYGLLLPGGSSRR
jgi:D-alanyl-D-alanine carboxypeptidase